MFLQTHSDKLMREYGLEVSDPSNDPPHSSIDGSLKFRKKSPQMDNLNVCLKRTVISKEVDLYCLQVIQSFNNYFIFAWYCNLIESSCENDASLQDISAQCIEHLRNSLK